MIKVAVVEDNKTTREGLRTIINLSGDFECVCVCETGEDALKVLPKDVSVSEGIKLALRALAK